MINDAHAQSECLPIHANDTQIGSSQKLDHDCAYV